MPRAEQREADEQELDERFPQQARDHDGYFLGLAPMGPSGFSSATAGMIS